MRGNISIGKGAGPLPPT